MHAARAVTTLRRVARIQRLLLQQLDLLDTMAPSRLHDDPHRARPRLGQESPGFRTMLRLPGEVVWPAFAAFLERRGVTLRADLRRSRTSTTSCTSCARALVDYDQLLQTWRQRHLMLVYRIIGTGTPSLKGKPSELLAHGMKQRFFDF